MKRIVASVLVLVLGLVGLLLAGCGSSAPAAGPAAAGPAPPPYTGGPRLYIPQRAFDGGKIPLNTPVTVRIDIQNIGDQPLIVPPPQISAVQGC